MKFYFLSFVILFFCMLLLAYASNCSEVKNPLSTYRPFTDTIVYEESNDDFPNPERGFYRPAAPYANHFIPLDINQIKTWRSLQQAGSSQYKVYSTLLY